jgi:hypothetical protein
MKTEFSLEIFEKYSYIKFHGQWDPIRSMQTDRERQDEANSRFSQFCERAWKCINYCAHTWVLLWYATWRRPICLLILFISLHKCLTQLSYTYAWVNIFCQLQLIN